MLNNISLKILTH
jgi:hypothetical protein